MPMLPPQAPRVNCARLIAIMPCKTRYNDRSARLTRANQITVRVISVVPSTYCRAAIPSNQLATFHGGNRAAA